MKNFKRIISCTLAIFLCGMSFLALPSAIPNISAHTGTVTQQTALGSEDYPAKSTSNGPLNWVDGAPGRFFVDSTSEGSNAVMSYTSDYKIDTTKKVTLQAKFTMFDYQSKRSMMGIGLQTSPGNPSSSSDWIYFSWEVNENSGSTHGYSIHTRKNSYNVRQVDNTAVFGKTVNMTFVLEPEDEEVWLSGYINGEPVVFESAPDGSGLVGQSRISAKTKTNPAETISGEYYVSILTYLRAWGYTDGITVTSEVPGQPETQTTVVLGADRFTPQNAATMVIDTNEESVLYAYGLKSVNLGAHSPYQVSADEGFSYEGTISFIKDANASSWAGLVLTRKPDSIDTGDSAGAVYILQWYSRTGAVQFVSYNKDSSDDLYNKPVSVVNDNAKTINEAHKLKLEYAQGVFTIWFDDVAYFTYEDPAFEGDWYLGVMGRNASAKFSDLSYTTVSDELDDVFTWMGFSIRVDAPYGLRAKYAISKDALAATLQTDNYRVVEYGAIVTQRESFNDSTGRTDAIPTLAPDGSAMDNTIVSPIWKDGEYLGSIHTETDNEMIYTGVLIDIAPQNLAKDYVFRAYCIVELDGGVQQVLYSGVSQRSIYDVALGILDDPDHGLTPAQITFIYDNIINVVEGSGT